MQGQTCQAKPAGKPGRPGRLETKLLELDVKLGIIILLLFVIIY